MLIFKGRNRVTSGYMLPDRPDHYGLDIVGDDSTDVLWPVDGTVKSSTMVTSRSDATWEWGNYVRVDDKDGNRLYFCHMASRAVKVGDVIKAGDKLGVMGNTGLSFGAHTHFEVRKSDGKTRLNPAEYLGIPNQKGTYTEGETQKDGWQWENEKWYCYEGGKTVKNAWRQLDGWWYYLGADGVMKTGWIEVDGKGYYLNETRITVGGKYVPEGACLITDESGAVV